MVAIGWMILFFLLNAFFAEAFSIIELGQTAAELELNIVLACHLKPKNRILGKSLTDLINALRVFEAAFYDPRVLSGYCGDPKDETEVSDIFTVAFKKDTVNPFAEKYNIKMLPLHEVDESLAGIKTFRELKSSERFDEVIRKIQEGELHFKYEHVNGYMAQVKGHIRGIMVERVTSLLLAAFEAQNYWIESYSGIIKKYQILNANIGHLDSYLTMLNARNIFINLPCIQFEPKKTQPYGM